MKKLAGFLIIFSFIAGSIVSIQDKVNVNWLYYSVLLAIGFIGIVILKVQKSKHSKKADYIQTNVEDIKNSLNSICLKMKTFEVKEADLENLSKKIDNTFLVDINKFLNSREVLKTRYGIKAFANVMSNFASGERYLNRAWTSSVDGYIDEAKMSIETSKQLFNNALEEFKVLK